MKYVPAALICLIITSFWYILHDVDFLAETTIGFEVTSSLYESPVYAGISLFVNALHYLSLIWIAYALWWRLRACKEIS